MTATTRLLAVGDVHLGRRPSRLPEGLDPRSVGPAAAWGRAVERALALEVDAVLLAGDVVESLDDRFEAFGPLEDGTRRLVDAGIPVVGVAGNHDVRALPRLAERIPGFTLLGAGGRWEATTIAPEDRPAVRIVGWSFPRERVEESPLASFEPSLAPRDGAATLGLLHADLDASERRYAPVRRGALEQTDLDAWLLGHVHAPHDLGEAPLGYLGTLSPLDPGEPGPRGPWLVDVEGPGRVRCRQLPLAPLRYDRVDVDVTALDEVDGELLADRLDDLVLAALQTARGSARESSDSLVALGLRVRLVGRTRHGRALRERARTADLSRFVVEGDVVAFVEAIDDTTRTSLDLEALARSDDPPGLVARRLLALERGGPLADELLERAERALRRTAESARPWGELGEARFDRLDARDRLLRAGTRALDALVEADSGGRP